MFRINKTLSFLFIFSFSFGYSQKGSQTPYSTFGLGEINMGEYAPFSSMGGVLTANGDSTFVNSSNPATYSFLDRYKPIFQIGLNGKLSTFTTTTASSSKNHFGLNQFQLGVPIKKRWGASFGLKPYSFTGYTISNDFVEDEDTSVFINEGSGGINKAYLGVAYQPIRSWTEYNDTSNTDTTLIQRRRILSLGANANYLFGTAQRNRSYEYRTSIQGYNSRAENGLRLNGFIYDFGISYQTSTTKSDVNSSASKTRSFGVGLTYSPAVSVKAHQDIFAFTYLGSFYESAPIMVDTIQFVTDDEGSVLIPEAYAFGLEYSFGQKTSSGGSKNNAIFKVSADVKYQKWSSFSQTFVTEENGGLKDRLSAGVGIEYIPSGTARFLSTTPLFGRMSYRFGLNYTQTELSIEYDPTNAPGLKQNIDSYGMSFGVGIPIAADKSNTNINFGATFGKLGTTDHGLIEEKYVGLYFGISITPGWGDYWFIKRKYD